jgi:SAM-dependent methyltransferase
MALIGHLNGVLNDHLWGWARNSENDEPVSVDIFLDGMKEATVLCEQFRQDLILHEKESGKHGFLFPLPDQKFHDFNIHEVEVRFSGTAKLLEDGKTVIDSEYAFYKKLHQYVFREGLWDIDEIILDDGIEIRGWMVTPLNWFGEWSITVNDRPVAKIQKESDFPRSARDFPFEKNRIFQFRGYANPKNAEQKKADLSFSLVDAKSFAPLVSYPSYFLLKNEFPMPAFDQRTRVIGHARVGLFQIHGSTTYVQLTQVLQRIFGKGFDDFPEIMDWGCGCGRVFRHIASRHRAKLVGVDIDPENIRWCREVFVNRSFELARVHPPLQQPAEEFDLIFGLSVFTHLKEDDQFKWLKELHRVTKPGAVLLMTVHGDHAWFRSNLGKTAYLNWKRAGFYDSHRDPALDGVISEKDYYRFVFHDPKYILQEWSRYFHVVQIIPGFFENWQDLVVLVRQ